MSEAVPGIELFLSSDKAVEGANKFRTATESAAAAVEKIGAAVDKMQEVINRLGGRTRKAGEDQAKAGEAADDYADSLYGVTKIAGKVVDANKVMGDSASKAALGMTAGASGAAALDRSLGGLGIRSIGVGRALTTLLGAAGAISGLGAGVAAFSDYEDKLQILGTIANATGGQLRELEQAANDLSRNTRFSPREALQGLTELSRAGLSAQDAMTALKPTADLARVGLIGLGDASGIVSKTMNQFGLNAAEAGRIADVLAKAANASNADVSQLADSLAKTGPVARQYGVSLEDTVAALAKIADNGLAANIAGTGLQRVLIQLRSPTEEAQRALLGLGLTAAQINPEKVGLIGALRNLANANVTVQDSVSLVGTEFASLLTVLTSSVGAIEKTGEALRDSTGESAKQAAAGANTLAASFADLRNASEQFAVSAGRGGIGGALQGITRTGAEVLRILADDKRAIEEAGIASRALATGLQLAAVAGTAFAAAKIAGVAADLADKMRKAATAIVPLESALGASEIRVLSASKAFAALSAVIRANPFIAAASAIAGVVSALYIFGGGSDEAAEKARRQQEAVRSLEERYASLRRAIELVVGGPGLFGSRDEQVAAFRTTQEELRKIGQDIETLRGKRVPIEQLFAGKLDGLTGTESQLGRIKALIEQIPSVQKQIAGSFDQFVGFGRQKEFEDQLKALGVIAEKSLGENIYRSDQLSVARQRFVEYGTAVDLVREALAALDKKASDAGVALARVGDASKLTDYSSAVRSLVEERERELKIAALSGVEREKAILLAEAEKRAGQGLTETEKSKLTALAQQVVETQKLIEARRHEEELARTAAKLQQDLPKNLAALQKKYDDELRAAQATGLQRELIRAEVEAENDAKQIGLALDSEALAKLKDKAKEAAKLAYEERNQKRVAPVERKQNEALLKLEQEEKLLRMTGAAREEYRLRIEAENDARQAGLKINSAEFRDYVQRRVELSKLQNTMEAVVAISREVGASWNNALESFIFDGARARDAARALAQDLQRLAFRQTVGASFQYLFNAAGNALGAYFAGTPSPGSGAFASNTPSQTSANYTVPFLTGGTIPAMGGQIIDEFSFLRRGRNTYSVAEGGRTTPEGIFRLARDERGNLGVSAVGAGGDSYHMSFPGIRTQSDMRAARMTMSQQVRKLRAAERGGRRGLRPRE